MKRLFHLLLPCAAVGVSALMLTGCSFSKAYPVKSHYDIGVQRSSSVPSQGSQVLCVQPLEVSEQFAGRGLVYRLTDVAYESDYYADFFTAPAPMLTDSLRQWMRDSGRYREVVSLASRLTADRVLEGVVDGLYGDYRDPQAPKAYVSLYIRLVDDSGKRPEVMFSKQYSESVAVDSRDAAALARGWKQALTQIFAAIEEDVSRL